ncbi:MAG: competence/damage-inducible protein A [Oscillospiraceae bacterium]|nr:competence/damage-inducible protein A [Oscillospiraceae bacterium]
MSHTAELIAVGTELLLGNIANTDAQMISEGLSTLGITVHYHTVVGDNPQRLSEALEIARRRADIIITTGGLGPTYDDLTKQTICKTFHRELELHEDILEEIRTWFQKRMQKKMPENNTQQAMLPVGCTIFDNPVGTAPGCAFEEGGVHVLMLPGPPFECRYMFENRAVPYLRQLTDGVIVSHEIRVYGMGESAVEEKLHGPMTTLTNPTLAPYAKTNEVMLRATAKAETAEAAEELLKPLVRQVREELGDVVYGVDVGSLEEVVSELLRKRGLTLSTAESCTGGLVAKRITDLPGASSIFRGGVVSYTDKVKSEVLGVSEAILSKYGAVSEPVARAMAEGCRRVCGSDLAVSVTGVAGPGTDERGTPVGTVFIGLASEQETLCRQYSCGRGRGRSRVRTSTAQNVFDLLRRYLLRLPLI